VEADDIRREKGTYTREKNLLFLKNVVELGKDLNFRLKKEVAERHKVSEIKFEDVFAGPKPLFEETKRMKPLPGSSKESPTSKKSSKDKIKEDKIKEEKSSNKHKRSKSNGAKASKNQGTLDGWVKGDKKASAAATADKSGKKSSGKVKKQTAAEIEAEMKRMREQNARFQEEMRRRQEEAKKKKLEEKVREKERKKEEKKLVNELLGEWKKKREDLECDNLHELPRPIPVQCRVPNHLFGDFLTLIQFVETFADVLETKDSFANGITFDILENALTDRDTIGGDLYDILNFFLGALFDLQDEEDEEVKLDRIANTNVDQIDKNILGKDKDIASQIKSATLAAQWPMKTQGVSKLRELHMDQWSITEILRQHLEAAGAFRSEKLIMWLYQQRGGYRLSDDPGLTFRMEEPQVLEALATKTVFELSCRDKIKILNCLMLQILSFATVRDDIEERYLDYTEAKSELRRHMINENKKVKEKEEIEKEKRKAERAQKKEGDLKKDENKPAATAEEQEKEKEEKEEKEKKEKEKSKKEDHVPEVHLTERQRLAIVSAKDKEEKEKQRKEEIERFGAEEKDQQMADKLADLQRMACLTCLGRDRAYRRYWVIDTVPGLFVEHEDDAVGTCLSSPTPYNPNGSTGPLDEDTALQKVREMMMSKGSKSPDEKASSDKENDLDNKSCEKRKKQQMKQKQVLSAKNGSMDTGAPSTSSGTTSTTENNKSAATVIKQEVNTEQLPWGSCLANNESCPVHSTILPRTSWSYFSTIEQVDDVIEKLNTRGVRESDLADKLSGERDKIARNLRKFNNLGDRLSQKIKEEKKITLSSAPESKEENGEDNKSAPLPESDSISMAIDLTLRDQILELEEKIYLGSLGTLKVRDRVPWRNAIQYGDYDRQCEALAWGGRSAMDTPFESRLHSVGASREGSPERNSKEKRDSSGSSNSATASHASAELKKVKGLSSAILQVSQMIDSKYFKTPLGEDEKEKKKRLKEEEKRKKVSGARNKDFFNVFYSFFYIFRSARPRRNLLAAP
jgi:bromodomain adjacent to zinc finger domain protein 1A